MSFDPADMPPKNPHGISALELRRASHTKYVQPALGNWAHLVVEPIEDASTNNGGCIFLGPQQAAGESKLDALKSASPPVGAIVNCTNAFPNHHENSSITYCRIAINDEYSANILIYLNGATDFIHHHVTKGASVLVHCQMGMSRSATVVIAYLMRYHSMTKLEAYNYVKERRPQTNPNAGFWSQLDIYEQRLGQNGIQRELIKKEVTFDKEWAELSLVSFQTTGHIVERTLELFPEINTNCNFDKIMETALDFLFGRGILESDLSWFSALCKACGDLGVDPNSLLNDFLNEGSDFMDMWCGDISSDQVQKVRDAATIKSDEVEKPVLNMS